MNKWYSKEKSASDIVFSTRIRLARNIKGFPFPNKMSDEQKYDIIQKISDAIFKSMKAEDYKFVDMDKISHIEANSLVERHLISPEFAVNTKGRALIMSNDESVGIMINEEDHIRIQVMAAGLDFDKAYEKALEIEQVIGKNVEFAFDKKFGYLTECPTNVGTGMRASAMLHIPALEKFGTLDRLFNTVSKMGVTIRGTFGEGSQANASMYQISNQVTLGITEKGAIENIKSVVNGICEKEKEARNSIDTDRLENMVYRAFGVLSNARIIDSDEFYELVSELKLGASMGVIDIPMNVIDYLIINCQPNCLQSVAGGVLDAEARDKKRATLIREKLTK